MKYFNTSGPNIPKEHYTLQRQNIIDVGIDMVHRKRYFTIWAPRQTGKSTYFRQLAVELEKEGYKVAHINFENYKNLPLSSFLKRLTIRLNEYWNHDFDNLNIGDIFLKIEEIRNQKCVLIIDEVEGINPEYFGEFLHSIRNAYHSRESHCLKSVILVGVSNIVGVVSDNASPFNIADNLNVPYFTDSEVRELLGQHETETGQLFEEKVKNKISQITANQPGLVNGFANKLVVDNRDKKNIAYTDYLKVEDWYLTEAIDKNFSNILNKAEEHRHFVERLLFTEDKIPFKIDRPGIKLLYTNGLIKKDRDGSVTFWVPFYKKRLYDAFYPYSNGEKSNILRNFIVRDLFDTNNNLIFDELIRGYKEHVKRRGFNAFREKDEKGKYKSIKESALIYSFETYIQAFLQVVDGKSYREADTGLGKSDLIINVNSEEYLIESKIYYYETQFLKGKNQLAYYCKSLGLGKGLYLVFCPNDVDYPETIIEQTETIEKVEISTYLILYDESKW
ncbi:MAG: AAA-like domain-containing protein [Bacteroidota bacterium]|nr:AAA-like domain-containing protein [Bacteroidota bacterium]